MASITAAAGRIRSQGASFITAPLVRSACEAAGHRWRQRVLGPIETMQLLVLQVMAGSVACRAVTMLEGRTFMPQAYCNARMRLPCDVWGYAAAAPSLIASHRL